MARRGRYGGSSRQPPPSKLKLFKPMSWYRHKSTSDYTAHIVRELGRLDLDFHDIEDYSRAPNRQSVLSDLLEWSLDQPAESFARLYDWSSVDSKNMTLRRDRDPQAKPRIEISAHITKMNNLSVLWHPSGWRKSEFNWDREQRHHYNMITHRRWTSPPDFWWFHGDEEVRFDSRPTNELMFIRGVGHLKPQPSVDGYGPYARCNRDVLDGLLVAAVRSAYEGLVERLRYSFEVDVLDEFDFEIAERSDFDDGGDWIDGFAHRQIVGWRLEDAATLRADRAALAEIEREKLGRAEIANIETAYGCTIEHLISTLNVAATPKPGKPVSSGETINRVAAKILRSEGGKLDAGDVRKLRSIIEDFFPDLLPENLRKRSVSEVKHSREENIVQFRPKSIEQDDSS